MKVIKENEPKKGMKEREIRGKMNSISLRRIKEMKIMEKLKYL